jgi:hypothetical protein
MEARMARVSDDEVLLLWRALSAFRSGGRPRCAPRGRPATSDCPLYDYCPRWAGMPGSSLWPAGGATWGARREHDGRLLHGQPRMS